MKVLIADGFRIIRERLRTLMLEIPNVELLAATATVDATLEAIEAHDPDVLVVDAQMLRGKAREFIEAVRKRKPAIVLIILSNVVSPRYRPYYEAAGADLFLDKSNEFIHLGQFVSELGRCPLREKHKASPEGARKQLVIAKLKVGIQLSLIAFSACKLFVGP